ncbi:MAG: TlpA disulfide reductase family protein [Candidatus Caldatribacteriota bacterium]|nr:TlpA disulfide reductase family protein [Candidatus Caldatribacteriota bacterium]
MKYFNTKNYLIVIVLTIILLFAVSFTSFSSSSLKKAFPAPAFTLKNIDEEIFNLKDYKGKQKLLILYFCNNENEDSVCGIEEFTQYFEEHIIEEKYQVIMINTRKDLKEENIKLIKEFWQKKGINFSILLDFQDKVSNLYNIEMIPTTIFLDKNLVVKRIYPGLLSKQQNIMFQYISYFLGAEKKESSKKERKEKDDDSGCDDGSCDPPPGY